MTISFKTRVKKITEDDILFGFDPLSDEKATWVWRQKGFRQDEIMDIEELNKQLTVITVYDYITNGPKKLVVKESFEDVILKWEIASTEAAVFSPEEGIQTEEETSSEEEED